MNSVYIFFLSLVAVVGSCSVDNTLCSTYSNCTVFQGCVTFNSTCLGGKYAGSYCNDNSTCGSQGICILKGLCYDIPRSGIAACNIQTDCRNGYCVTGLGYGMCASTGKPCTQNWQCGGCDICSKGSCILHYNPTTAPPTTTPLPTISQPPTFPPIPSYIPCLNDTNTTTTSFDYDYESTSGLKEINGSSIIVYLGITSYGTSLIAQDISVMENNTIQGNIQIGGNIHIADKTANEDYTYALSTYSIMSTSRCDYGPFPPGQDLGGLTLIPGTYCFNSWAQVSSSLTFDLVTQEDAKYIFNIPAGLKIGDGVTMSSVNLASIPFCNINWVVGGIVEIGDDVSMGGDIFVYGNATIGTSELFGRIISITGGLTMTNSSIASNDCIYGILSPTCTNQPSFPIMRNKKEEYEAK